MTEQQNHSGVKGRFLVLMWLAIAVALLVTLRESETRVEIYGAEMAIWIVAIFYGMGLAEGWAAFMARWG